MNTSWPVECARRSVGSEAPRRAARVHHTRAARARVKRVQRAGADAVVPQRQRTRGARRSRAQPAETLSGNAPRKERSTSSVSSGAQTQRRKGDGASALRDGRWLPPHRRTPSTPLCI